MRADDIDEPVRGERGYSASQSGCFSKKIIFAQYERAVHLRMMR
jgi:hypothetical protein